MTYLVDVTFVSYEKSLGETALDIHISAADHLRAVQGAKAWAENRRKNLGFASVTSITVYEFNPKPVDADGNVGPSHGSPLFQWKADTATFDQSLTALIDNMIKHDRSFNPSGEELDSYAKRHGIMSIGAFEDAYTDDAEQEYECSEILEFYRDYIRTGEIFN